MKYEIFIFYQFIIIDDNIKWRKLIFNIVCLKSYLKPS
jgi:hypothetical protein